MQILKVNIDTGVCKLLWWTCWLEEQYEPYMENTSKEFFAPTLMPKPEPEFWQSAHVSIISACFTGSDIKATL